MKVRGITLHFIAALVACWPLYPWLWDRWTRWEGMYLNAIFLAAGLVGWVTLRRGHEAPEGCTRSWLFTAGSAFFVSGALWGSVPRLMAFTITAFGAVVLLVGSIAQPRRSRVFGLIPLLPLTLPVMPSIQYAFGYPLRVLTTQLAALGLGSGVNAAGTGLTDGARLIFVDAPCSGLRMLSTALILASASALVMGLRPFRTGLLLGAAVILAVAGNTARAVNLYLVETGRLGSGMDHTSVGLITFVLSAATLIGMAWLLGKGDGKRSAIASAIPDGNVPSRWITSFFLLSALVAAGSPMVHRAFPESMKTYEVEWPATFDGIPLHEAEMAPEIRTWMRGFPGRMAEFEVGDTGRRVMLRWTPEATRMLHPAETCFEAFGRKVSASDAVRDGDGTLWSAFRVLDDEGRPITMRQGYFAVDPGRRGKDLRDWIRGAPSWPDASSWYWAAALPGSTVESTLAITVSERLE